MSKRRLQLESKAPIFAALGDPVRLALVSQLSQGGPLPTIQLKQSTNLSRQAVTKHLQILEDTGIVKSKRVGRDRQWQIELQKLVEVRRCLEQISTQWDQTLERLRQFVEDNPE